MNTFAERLEWLVPEGTLVPPTDRDVSDVRGVWDAHGAKPQPR